VLCLAISYGGRSDIVESCRALAAQVARGELSAGAIDETLFARHTQLGAHGIPDPDLLVRTSGEQRLSNFLLWNCAYTEFETVYSLCT
jgi:undecaprenyl diphosphate synthase